MGFESNSISIPFHWSGGILAITIVVSIILVGTGFYIASLNWPTVMLWLKYLLIIVFFIAIIVGVGYMPIRLKADNGKIMVKNLFGSPQILLSDGFYRWTETGYEGYRLAKTVIDTYRFASERSVDECHR